MSLTFRLFSSERKFTSDNTFAGFSQSQIQYAFLWLETDSPRGYHNNFRPTLCNFFRCKQIHCKLHNIVVRLLQWVWVGSIDDHSLSDHFWLICIRCKSVLIYSDNENKTNLLVLQNLETFIWWFDTKHDLFLIFAKRLLLPHKTAYFSNNLSKIQITTQSFI